MKGKKIITLSNDKYRKIKLDFFFFLCARLNQLIAFFFNTICGFHKSDMLMLFKF